MGFFDAIAKIGGAVASPVATLGAAGIGALANADANKKNAKANKQINAANISSQEKINQQNIDFQTAANAQEQANYAAQFDYTKQTQAEQWRRDDNTLQRSVADAESAGLSPLAALGINNTGSAVSQPSSPSFDTPDLNAIMQQPNHYDSIMSGVNLDSLADSFIAMQRQKTDDVNAETSRMAVLNQNEQKNLDRKKSEYEFKAKLDQTNKHFAQTIEKSENEFQKKFSQSVLQFNTTLERIRSATSFTQKMEQQKYLLSDIKALQAEASGKTGNLSNVYKIYNDQAQYDEAMRAWTNRYADWAAVNFSKPSRTSSMQAGSNGVTAGASGAATPFGLNAGANQSNAGSLTQDFSLQDQHTLINWYRKNPVPIYRPK